MTCRTRLVPVFFLATEAREGRAAVSLYRHTMTIRPATGTRGERLTLLEPLLKAGSVLGHDRLPVLELGGRSHWLLALEEDGLAQTHLASGLGLVN